MIFFASIITDPSGNSWASTSEAGFFWAGFGVGLTFLGFRIIVRMAQRIAGSTSDF
jgi:hypothetical protein